MYRKFYTRSKSILAPIRRSAIIVLTAFIHLFLITYRLSFAFVMDSSVLRADFISQGCVNASFASIRFLKKKFIFCSVFFFEKKVCLVGVLIKLSKSEQNH